MKSIKFFNIDIDIDEMKSNYKLNDLKVLKYTVYDLIIILINEENSKKLEENWQKISSVLSESLEEELQVDNFIRWNVYIIYILEGEVTKELKYKIENNTFFARKIVDDNYSLELIDENIQELIEKHITFEDIKLSSVSNANETYVSDSKVYLELKNFNSMNSHQIKKVLETLEKDAQDEI